MDNIKLTKEEYRDLESFVTNYQVLNEEIEKVNNSLKILVDRKNELFAYLDQYKKQESCFINQLNEKYKVNLTVNDLYLFLTENQ